MAALVLRRASRARWERRARLCARNSAEASREPRTSLAIRKSPASPEVGDRGEQGARPHIFSPRSLPWTATIFAQTFPFRHGAGTKPLRNLGKFSKLTFC